MKKELELELVKKYPKLYERYGGDVTKTCLAFGFECSDGWFDIISRLSEEISVFEDVRAEQVKEKFGGLRFYIDGCTEENHKQVYDIIAKYEDMSYETCEWCSKPGKRVSGGWVLTLCSECENKRNLSGLISNGTNEYKITKNKIQITNKENGDLVWEGKFEDFMWIMDGILRLEKKN